MKKIIAILALGIIVLLAGCAQQQQGQQLVQYVCSNGTVVVDKNLCPTVQAGGLEPVRELTIEEELNVCSGMPETKSGSFENICIMGVAAKHSDASLCKKLSQDQRVTCYSMIAEVTENADVCLEAGLQKDNCFNNYATNTNNSAICDKITEISTKDNCYRDFSSRSGEASLCDKIKTADIKNNCYFQIAQRLGDTAYCNKITNASMKDNCLQNTGNVHVQQPAKP